MSGGLVTVTIACVVAGIVITITAPPMAAVAMCAALAVVYMIGYKKVS
jgi:hypothetical protein